MSYGRGMSPIRRGHPHTAGSGDDGAASSSWIRRAVTRLFGRWRRADQDSDVDVIARRMAEEQRSPAQRWLEGDYDR